jgi:hypothetical protein
MSDKKYNGWANYETWCINLWLTNDGDSYLVELAENYDKVYEFADAIKDYVEELREGILTNSATFVDDLINASLAEVNYYEIALSIIEGNEDLEEQFAEDLKK